jgi:hypothetical protein
VGRIERMARHKALPAAVAIALAATLVTDVVLVVNREPAEPSSDDLVSVGVGRGPAPRAAPVAPLTKRHVPHLLIASGRTIPAGAVERARRLKGVAGLTVVDAARAQVGGRRMGLLGVDPSSFRAFVPEQSATSDQLWQTVATGGLAVSFTAGRDGALPLGGMVDAGRTDRPGRVRVGAYAAMGIGDVDAVVSRQQARALGLPQGNALLVSAPKTNPDALTRQLRRILPKGTRFAKLNTTTFRRPSGNGRAAPERIEVAARPDGVQGLRSSIAGNLMTRTMQRVVMEIDSRYGPFPTIGCYRAGVDAQDHAHGRACDFMESVGGRMPSASALRHGDQVAQYAISNAGRLGISYVIWKQHIWNVRGGGWRPMEDRGSLTQNHWDHVHISVLR